MITITRRNSVSVSVSATITGLTTDALKWMQEKYPDINFENINYIFSASYKRSRYFRNENNEKHKTPTVCICTRARLILYPKVRLNIKHNNLYVGSSVQIMCALIHELTHHVQYEKGERIGNETDTTKNELLYLQQHHLTIYNQIIQQ